MKRRAFENRERPQTRMMARVRRGIGSALAFLSNLLARPSRRAELQAANDRIEHLNDTRWQLAETQTRFRELLDSQTELIVRRDRDGRIVFANAAFCKAFGIALDDVRGNTYWPPVIQSLSSQACDAGGTRRIESLQTVCGSRWFEWEQLRVAAADEPGDIQYVGRDVTEALRLESELRDARDQADAANRAKSRFLAAMSHEIRTPMNGILGMVSLIQETHLSDEQQAYTRAIDLSAKSLLALIDEILDFSKIESGKLQLSLAPFSLRGCVASALELMQPNAARRGNALSHTIDDDVPLLMLGDAVRLRQIILNLVSNAVKFTENGTISVAVHRKTATQYALVVRDTGIGFSEETMRVLFHEFEQAEDLQGGRQDGTGLGLAISQRLARAMGGDITAVGVLGEGATFTATFNLSEYAQDGATAAADEEAETTRLAQRSVRDTGAPRILLAEDNDVNALLARRVCERAGCTVVVVKDGRAAVEAVAQSATQAGQAFNLILMDVFMPQLDGLEATRLIKAAPGDCPPIIALTANAFADDRDRCLAAGMDDYLAKPFDVQQLQAVVQRWLPVSSTRRAS